MEPANHRNLSNHPIAGSLGSLYSLYGYRDPASCGGLVIYAVFPILQGTLTGLAEIDPYLGSGDSLWDDQVGKAEKI